MGFQHGLSGLNAASKNLDVIGHNVANANTIGAKMTRVAFADQYATAMAGSSTFSGLGVSVNEISQIFTQGDLTSTANPLDLAINGNGFFQLNSTSIGTSYTRNGQFKLDKDGFIVTPQGDRLAGFAADERGEVRAGVASDLQISAGDMQPQETTQMQAVLNLDARDEVSTAAFDMTDPDTYSAATSLKVYDEQGRDTTLALYFSKTADNAWDVYGTADGTEFGGGPIAGVNFNSDGTVDTTTTTVPTAVNVPTANGVSVPIDVDLSSITQFGSLFGVNELRQDGFTTGKLVGFGIEGDGLVMARYTNGQSRAQGQIVLANFTNKQGLIANGGNNWLESSESGPALIGSPGSASLGQIKAGALEQSNVDLTGELVNMIMAQRSYQANAQTIRAQDQIVQTVINLR